jgi:hypothetical protein
VTRAHPPAAAPPGAEIRGAVLRLYLDPAVTPSASLRAALRAALPEGAAARVERAGAAEWLPVEWEVAILRAIHAEGGDGAVLRTAAALARAARSTPVFRTLYAATLGVLGRSREAMVRVAVASWELGMRNAGRRGPIESDGRAFRITHEELPASWDRLLVLRVCGSAEVMLEWKGVAPRAEAEWTEGATRVVYVLTWP